MPPKSDSNTRDRAGRLSELRKEALVAFGCGDPPSTAEQHLVECWATLKLGFEVLSARLVGGSAVDAVELIKLNEALSAYMPPRKQHQVDKLIVEFVPPTNAEEERLRLRDENELLRRGIDELKAALRQARGEPDPEPVLSIPDSAITPPARALPAPPASGPTAEGWAAALGHQPRSPTACWTAAGGYYDPDNR
jgi:hypothetical protein